MTLKCLVWLVGALLIAGACSSGGSGGTVITSDDGKATLTIPDGALPEGLSASDISVTAITEGDLQTIDFGPDAAGTVLAGYILEPEGTQFQVPVSLRIQIDEPITGPPFSALLEFGEDLEFLSVSLEHDPSAERVVSATLEVPHFTEARLLASDAFLRDVGLQPVDTSFDLFNVPVGEGFELIGGARVNRAAGEIILPSSTISWGENTEYNATLFFTLPSDNLSPDVLVLHGNVVDLRNETREVVSMTQTFVCEAGGDFNVSFLGSVTATLRKELVGRPEAATSLEGRYYKIARVRGRCIEGQNGEDCSYAYQCGAGRLCGDGKCKDDSGSMECTGDDDCGGTRSVCMPVVFMKGSGGMRCADCRDNSQCSGVHDVCVNNHCVECDIDSDCTTNICAPDKTCGECRSAADCETFPGQPMCVAGKCVQCGSDAECTGSLSRCGADGFCAQCASDADCEAPLDRCRMGRCNSCVSDSDCPSLALSSCNFSGCSTCDGDFDCDGDYTCENNTGFDNACTLDCNGDGDCEAGQKCIANRCAQCQSNGDCPTIAPFCGPDGHCFECTPTEPCTDGRICKISTGQCVHCLGDSDCKTPGLSVCEFNACTTP
jgi:hypothetical protein